MDILNWLYLRKEQLIRKTANNAETDLIAVGADVTFAKRDDKYKTYAMSIKDLVNSADAANTGYYTLDFNNTSTVDVTTPKGVIEITMFAPALDPAANFITAVPFAINNASMDFSDADNIYMQVTPYYNPGFNDSFIPYVLSTGFIPLQGANFALFNASPVEIRGIGSVILAGSTALIGEANKIYTYLPSIPTTGSGATFTITRDGGGNVDTILITNTGNNYSPGDTIVIPGNYVGGTSGVDDIILNVDTLLNDNIFTGTFYVYYELYNF